MKRRARQHEPGAPQRDEREPAQKSDHGAEVRIVDGKATADGTVHEERRKREHDDESNRRAQRFGQASSESRRHGAEPKQSGGGRESGTTPHANRFFTRKNRLWKPSRHFCNFTSPMRG